MSQQDPRYPIGRYEPKPYSDAQRDEWLADIRFLPNALDHALLNLDEVHYDSPYREGGWTIRQLVHHIADSHMNALIRFKLGYTEAQPPIKPYQQDAWVRTADVELVPVNVSVTLLHALHARWVVFLESFTREDWEKTMFHPEDNQSLTLWFLLGRYAWHSRHHIAHIQAFRDKQGLN